MKARQEVNAAFAAFERDPAWYDEVSSTGLIGAAVGAFVNWMSSD